MINWRLGGTNDLPLAQHVLRGLEDLLWIDWLTYFLGAKTQGVDIFSNRRN